MNPDHPGSDQDDVDLGRGANQTEVNVVAVREVQRLPRPEIGSYLFGVHIRLELIRNQNRNNVTAPDCLSDGDDFHAVLLRLVRIGVAWIAHNDGHSGIAQIQRL